MQDGHDARRDLTVARHIGTDEDDRWVSSALGDFRQLPGLGNRHGRMDAVFPRSIVGGGHNTAAFPAVRISPDGQRKSAKAWRVTLFYRRVKSIHIEMGDDAHG